MYAYAFLNSPETPLELPIGIAGKVQLVASDRLVALVEFDLSPEAIQNDSEQLMQAVLCHDRVICEVFRQQTLLPLRFGTYFVSVEAILAHLEAGREEYLKQLERLAGLAEYCLKLLPLSPPIPSEIASEARGKQYFLAKKQRYRSHEDFLTEQTEQWQVLAIAIERTYQNAIVFGASDNVKRVYILCDRQHETELYQHLSTWQQACSHWQLYLGEPLPPYHFVAGASD